MKLKILVLPAFIFLCVLPAYGQKKSTGNDSTSLRGTRGHEAAKGEVNMMQLSNYLKAHPDSVKHIPQITPDNKEEQGAIKPPPIKDKSLIHKMAVRPRTLLTTTVRLPMSPPPADTIRSLNPGGNPPDTHGAVDSTYNIITENVDMSIYRKNGDLVSYVGLYNFFQTIYSGQYLFDPMVRYDPCAKRWYVIADADAYLPTACILIAVSATNDPTGNWFEYKIAVDSAGHSWLDQPNLGFNSKWITIGGNLFTPNGGCAKIYAPSIPGCTKFTEITRPRYRVRV